MLMAPGCATTRKQRSREAIEVVVWAALAAIDEPQPSPAPSPLPVEAKAKPCVSGTCRSVVVKP